MSGFDLHVDQCVVETEAEEYELRGAEPQIREAFRLLARRLEQTPFRHFGGAREQTIETLRLSQWPFDELLGPRGAERLADELYHELARRIGK